MGARQELHTSAPEGRSEKIKANTRILGIAGSLRKAPFDRMALNAAQGLVPVGATLEILDLPDLPGFNQDNEKSPPAAVTDMKAKIRAADAILLVTPEYNYSIPGIFVPLFAIASPRAFASFH